MTRGRWLVVVRVVVGLLVLAAVVVAVVRNWDAVSADIARVSAGALALSSALALLSLVFTLIGWRALMADLGSPLPLGPASGVLFIGQLGKYVPGSVWTVVVQAEVASALGVPRQRTAVAGLLSVVLSALAGLGIGIIALPALLSSGGDSSYLLVLLVVPLGLAVLHPRVLNAIIARVLRRFRRPELEHPLSGKAITVTMAAFLAAWLCLGLHVFTLVVDLGGSPGQSIVPAVFGYALAAAIGMVVVLLPAGIGLREAVLVLLLTGPLNKSAAGAVVLLSRFIITGSDVVAAAVGWLYDRSHHLMKARRDAAAGDQPPPPAP
ncbi:lysylphosphatidylglycerol synthase domain-containing protein [Angustibacter luteus]|uniref:Lysylphosphatidylglycerol synthase domain-containing protein n=1 Tax=Angustibacter luteus TaxID=658456 RepID=A0ABW1JHK2_9ACTN